MITIWMARLIQCTVDLDLSTPGIQKTYTVAGEGTYTVDNSGNVTYTPALNFYGIATTVYYTVEDNLGLSSDTIVPAGITVTVTHVNVPPVAVNDSILAPSNTNVVFSITSNDYDVDGTVDPSTVDLNPSFPGIQNTFTTGDGTYTVDINGILTFTPLPAFVGPASTTPIYYIVNDNSGATSNLASIKITLSNPNAPIAVNDTASMNENGTPITINVTTNDIPGSGNIDTTSVDLDPFTAGQQLSKVTLQEPGVLTSLQD